MEMGWKEDFCIDPLVSPEQERADLAVAEYDERCEAYDRLVCRARSKDGIAIPSDGHELAIINENARIVKRQVMTKYRIEPKEFQDATKRRVR